jgi:prepilin-type processing-associated H-X9-DG protein
MIDLFEGGGAVVNAGYAYLPSKPGLGVTLNEKLAAARPYKPAGRGNILFRDGSVADQ